MICLSNKIQKEHSKQYEDEKIYYLDHFLLELVKKRLDLYAVSNTADMQTLADIIIMLYIHPTKIKNLHISNRNITGYVKN